MNALDPTRRRVVVISDTHLRHDGWDVPDGDILVHCGDHTVWGTVREVSAALEWFAALPHRRKVMVAGNHDFLFQRDLRTVWKMLVDKRMAYLQDNGIAMMGLRIWGTPWSRTRSGDWAFNNDGGPGIQKAWEKIPEDLDLLISHSPPGGILDAAYDADTTGCPLLMEAVRRAAPKYHVFGHIHESYGRKVVGPTTFVNAAVCDLFYNPVNPAQIIDFPGRLPSDPIKGIQ
jgi:Icc-related predicted phosphoesterase